MQLRWRLLRRLGPLAAVPAAFVAFLLANGHVVVGDHSMHAPVPHLAHPLHFLLFAGVALAPAAFSPSRSGHAHEPYPTQAISTSMMCGLHLRMRLAAASCMSGEGSLVTQHRWCKCSEALAAKPGSGGYPACDQDCLRYNMHASGHA